MLTAMRAAAIAHDSSRRKRSEQQSTQWAISMLNSVNAGYKGFNCTKLGVEENETSHSSLRSRSASLACRE